MPNVDNATHETTSEQPALATDNAPRESSPVRSASHRTDEANPDASGSLRLRAIVPVIKAAGLMTWTISFVVLFVLAAVIVAMFEPAVATFRDALWLMFQVVTTIGLGDYTCVTFAGRLATIVLSIYSVLFLALITGAMVNYCSERMHNRRNESVAHFMDQLEHLPELSHEELVELSEKVKRFR